MEAETGSTHIRVRFETKRALDRVRMDESYPTFDQVIMEALRAKYGHKYDF